MKIKSFPFFYDAVSEEINITSMTNLPNPNEIYSLKCGLKSTCYLKPLIEEQKVENVEVGDFSYSYPDFAEHILHHYEWLGDKLKIGKFCQIGKQVRFFMNGCNHKKI